MLPCFDALPAELQRPIRFTQAKLGFNHGWLVQAEAPPGALFNSFKSLLEAGGLDGGDVAFYFVHWLTDLAGAEPTPLRASILPRDDCRSKPVQTLAKLWISSASYVCIGSPRASRICVPLASSSHSPTVNTRESATAADQQASAQVDWVCTRV